MRRRREAAKVSLRTMSGRLGYNSHTTVLAYEQGKVMPTDEVVAGYEKLLRLEPGSLTSVLEAARVEKHGDPFSKRRTYVPMTVEPPTDSASLEKREHTTPKLKRWKWLRATAVAVPTTAVIVFAAILWISANRDDPAATGLPELIVTDATDPKVTGCADDASTLDVIDVHFPAQFLIGQLELRASKRCGTSWGKFTQSPGLPQEPSLMLEITAYRPADAASSRFAMQYAGQGIYGNQLISHHQCVYTEIVVAREGQRSPGTRTRCLKSD